MNTPESATRRRVAIVDQQVIEPAYTFHPGGTLVHDQLQLVVACTGRLRPKVADVGTPEPWKTVFAGSAWVLIEESRCDMVFGPVLVTYLVTALGGVSLCLLITVLTSRHRESL